MHAYRVSSLCRVSSRVPLCSKAIPDPKMNLEKDFKLKLLLMKWPGDMDGAKEERTCVPPQGSLGAGRRRLTPSSRKLQFLGCVLSGVEMHSVSLILNSSEILLVEN